MSSLLISHPFVFLLYILGDSSTLFSSLHFYHHHILNFQELIFSVPLFLEQPVFICLLICVMTAYLPKDIKFCFIFSLHTLFHVVFCSFWSPSFRPKALSSWQEWTLILAEPFVGNP